MTKYLLTMFAYLAVLYPLWVRYGNISWTSDFNSILYNLFPGFGLLAFSLLWLHAISGAFEPWLRKQFDFDRFVRVTSIIVLICLIMHPLLFLFQLGFDLGFLITGGTYVWLAVIGWFLLITYDIGKILQKKYDFFVTNWNKILLISTIGFLLTFFHSLGLGSDIQSGLLRVVWIFYGITAIMATIYTYGISRRMNHLSITPRKKQ